MLLLGCLTALPSLLAGQDWNQADLLPLVDRGIAFRTRTGAEGGLRQLTSRAVGTVLLLTRIGSDPLAPPRLLKTDQLDVEVYWRAPNQSKQIIRHWRERTDFPTDIRYHRDHLGIIPDHFGPTIRMGMGDEVRDVIHPLSEPGRSWYEFRGEDSLSVAVGDTRLSVRAVQVRPRDPALPGVVGTMHLDLATGALVRFRFSFTPAAYLQPGLETITLDLEAALFEQRWWLPFRQTVEITRQAGWLGLPVTSVIRTSWLIGDYQFDVPVREVVWAGGPYGGLRGPGQGGTWDDPLERVIADALGDARRFDLREVTAEAASLLSESSLRLVPPATPALGGVSDLVRVNRVQGVALGLGLNLQTGPVELRPWAQVATVDGRLQGGLTLTTGSTATRWRLLAERRIADQAAWPVVSGVVNSLTAMGGTDHGDYVQRERLELGVDHLGHGFRFTAALGAERSEGLAAVAEPLWGTRRPNPDLGGGGYAIGRLGGRWDGGGADRGHRLAVDLLGGTGDRDFLQLRASGEGWLPVGGGTLGFTARSGLNTGNAPGYLNFALGGRGTLPGEPYRGWGGRRVVLGRLDWRFRVPVPMPGLGPYPAVPDRIGLGPFVAAGWAAGDPTVPGWRPDGGIRPVVGLSAEVGYGLVRLEAGWGVRSGRFTVVFDAAPAWWPVL